MVEIKNILVLGEGPTQNLDNATITAEAKCPTNFREPGKRFALSLHNNKTDTFLFVNAVKMNQIKLKSSEIQPYLLCLGNISKSFSLDNMHENKIIFLLIMILLIPAII